MSKLQQEIFTVSSGTELTLANDCDSSSVLVYYRGMGGFTNGNTYTVTESPGKITFADSSYFIPGDKIIVYYAILGESVVCTSQTIQLNETNINNRYIDLSLTIPPIDTENWMIELFAGPNQFLYHNSTPGTSELDFLIQIINGNYRLSWNSLIMEQSIIKAIESNPTIDISFRLSYSINNAENYFYLKRICEKRYITPDDFIKGGIKLYNKPYKPDNYEFHFIVDGGPSQIYNKDFIVEDKYLKWITETGFDAVNNHHVNIIYYTFQFDLTKHSIKPIVQLASSKGKGLCPKLNNQVRPYGTTSQNITVSEKALRIALDEFNPSLSVTSSSGVSFYDSIESTVETKTITKPRTLIDLEPLSYKWNSTNLYLNGFIVEGDYTWLDTETSSNLIIVNTSGESEIIPEDPKWVQSPCGGGNEYWSGKVIEKDIPASGYFLFSVPSGSLVGGIKLNNTIQFNTSSDIYSLGTDYDREALTRKFYAPTTIGTFNKWEPSLEINKNGFVYFNEDTDIKLYCHNSARELRATSAKLYDLGDLNINIYYDVIDWEDYNRCYVASLPNNISEYGYSNGLVVRYYSTSNLPSLSGAVGLFDNNRNDVYYTGGIEIDFDNYLYKWNRSTQTGANITTPLISLSAYMGAVSVLQAGWFLGGKNISDTDDLSNNVSYFRFEDETLSFYKVGLVSNPVNDFGCALISNHKALIVGGEALILDATSNYVKTSASNNSSIFNCYTKTMENIAGGVTRTGLRGAAIDTTKAVFIGGYNAGSDVDSEVDKLIGQPVNDVNIYDSVTTTFKLLCSMPYNIARSAVLATPNKIHVIGGETYRNQDDSVFKTGSAITLMTSTNTWQMNAMRGNLFAGSGYTQLT